jgi:hypothetical protein
MTKPVTVNLEWKLLEKIASYYKFPVAVFLLTQGNFDKTLERAPTRDEAVIKQAEAYREIVEIVLAQLEEKVTK